MQADSPPRAAARDRGRMGREKRFGMGMVTSKRGGKTRNYVFQGVRHSNKVGVTDLFKRLFVFQKLSLEYNGTLTEKG
jgi:hypothetical protein